MSRLSQPDSSEIPARPKGPGFESSHPTVQNGSRSWRHRQRAHVLNEKNCNKTDALWSKMRPDRTKTWKWNFNEALRHLSAAATYPGDEEKKPEFFFDRAKDLETENLAPPNFGQNSKSCIDNFFKGMKICDILAPKFKFCASMQRKNNFLGYLNRSLKSGSLPSSEEAETLCLKSIVLFTMAGQ